MKVRKHARRPRTSFIGLRSMRVNPTRWIKKDIKRSRHWGKKEWRFHAGYGTPRKVPVPVLNKLTVWRPRGTGLTFALPPSMADEGIKQGIIDASEVYTSKWEADFYISEEDTVKAKAFFGDWK